jgi:hypothetical protein
MRRASRTTIAVAGAGALAVALAGGLAFAAIQPEGDGRAPSVYEGAGVRYSDSGVAKTVRVPGTSVVLPAGSQDLVKISTLTVARRANGKVYLIGPGVYPGTVCMVALREDAASEPAAIGCDPEADARRKGIYLASDDPSGVDGGVFVGTNARTAKINGNPVHVEGGVATFRLPANGGTVGVERSNGEPPISFTISSH